MAEEIPIGLCQCGCGQQTKMETRGSNKGNPREYVRWHHVWRNGHGLRWNGGKTNHTPYGYIKAWAPNHPRAHDGYVLEHILVAEKALGHLLPDKAEVHHVDYVKSNNKNGNLVICQDHAYHQILHIRAKALEECGNANYLKCNRCWEYSDPSEMKMARGHVAYHPECYKEYLRRWSRGISGRLERRASA
jgi:hypothetical protein